MREHLTAAVSDRPDGVRIPDALRMLYREDAWHEDALAETIAAELGISVPDATVRAFCRFVLHVQLINVQERTDTETTDAAFDLLTPGWESYLTGR